MDGPGASAGPRPKLAGPCDFRVGTTQIFDGSSKMGHRVRCAACRTSALGSADSETSPSLLGATG